MIIHHTVPDKTNSIIVRSPAFADDNFRLSLEFPKQIEKSLTHVEMNLHSKK
jgi:hypothetical protein